MKANISYEDLRTVPIKECGEPLLCIQDHLPDVICQPQNNDMFQHTQHRIFVREGCLERLKTANEILRSKLKNARLLIVYGYRHPAIQKKYFDEQCHKVEFSNENDLLEYVHQLIAVPDVAGHPTGGAVDVTIQVDGINLDMGTKIFDFDHVEKLPTFSNKINKEQMKNRLLLRSVMLQASFAPFNGEWWHFSYGDKEWAYYYQRPFAIYKQLYFSLKN